MNLLFALASLAGIWFLVVTIPGPNFVLVTQYSMSDSRKSGLFIALGVSAGAATWATSSLVGLSVVFEHATWLYDTIRFVGGLYLIFIGLKTIFFSFYSPRVSGNVPRFPGGIFFTFRRGLFTSFSNPKTAAFFGSLFIATFPPQAPVWFYFVTVSVVFCISVTWYSLVAYFFSISQVQSTYSRIRKVVDKITGSVLLILGVRLAFSKS
jgi:RhtB (resistance to homoserine/threonine) family protein